MGPEKQIALKFARLSQNALPPVRGSDKAAGYDLKRWEFLVVCQKRLSVFLFLNSCFSAYDYTIPARSKELVKTDLQIELPHGCYGRIAPRSGLAWKNFIDVGGKNDFVLDQMPLTTSISSSEQLQGSQSPSTDVISM